MVPVELRPMGRGGIEVEGGGVGVAVAVKLVSAGAGGELGSVMGLGLGLVWVHPVGVGGEELHGRRSGGFVLGSS